MSQNIKSIKKGEYLFKEGDVVDKVFLIQSGRVNLVLERGSKQIEVMQLGPQRVVADEMVFSTPKTNFSAIAATPVNYLEIPMKVIKEQVSGISAGVKFLVNSMAEDNKKIKQFLKSSKLETSSALFPDVSISRVFGGFSLIVQQYGKKLDQGEHELPWDILKKYLVRFFAETPQKLIWALEILERLDLAELRYQKNEDDEEELHTIIFKDIKRIEQFADFHQYYYFKPGRSEILFVDSAAIRALEAILMATEEVEPDFKGVTRMDYALFLEKVKQGMGFEFKPLYLNLLEKKGIFVNRKSTDDNVYLELHRSELLEVYRHWVILDDIKYLNEFSKVRKSSDVQEVVDLNKCLECGSKFAEGQKFCSECGAKLAAA